MADTTPVFAVEKVVDSKIGQDGCRYYQVKWADSWEPEENLEGCIDLVNAYWESVHTREKKLVEKIQNDVQLNIEKKEKKKKKKKKKKKRVLEEQRHSSDATLNRDTPDNKKRKLEEHESNSVKQKGISRLRPYYVASDDVMAVDNMDDVPNVFTNLEKIKDEQLSETEKCDEGLFKRTAKLKASFVIRKLLEKQKIDRKGVAEEETTKDSDTDYSEPDEESDSSVADSSSLPSTEAPSDITEEVRDEADSTTSNLLKDLVNKIVFDNSPVGSLNRKKCTLPSLHPKTSATTITTSCTSPQKNNETEMVNDVSIVDHSPPTVTTTTATTTCRSSTPLLSTNEVTSTTVCQEESVNASSAEKGLPAVARVKQEVIDIDDDDDDDVLKQSEFPNLTHHVSSVPVSNIVTCSSNRITSNNAMPFPPIGTLFPPNTTMPTAADTKRVISSFQDVINVIKYVAFSIHFISEEEVSQNLLSIVGLCVTRQVLETQDWQSPMKELSLLHVQFLYKKARDFVEAVVSSPSPLLKLLNDYLLLQLKEVSGKGVQLVYQLAVGFRNYTLTNGLAPPTWFGFAKELVLRATPDLLKIPPHKFVLDSFRMMMFEQSTNSNFHKNVYRPEIPMTAIQRMPSVRQPTTLIQQYVLNNTPRLVRPQASPHNTPQVIPPNVLSTVTPNAFSPLGQLMTLGFQGDPSGVTPNQPETVASASPQQLHVIRPTIPMISDVHSIRTSKNFPVAGRLSHLPTTPAISRVEKQSCFASDFRSLNVPLNCRSTFLDASGCLNARPNHLIVNPDSLYTHPSLNTISRCINPGMKPISVTTQTSACQRSIPNCVNSVTTTSCVKTNAKTTSCFVNWVSNPPIKPISVTSCLNRHTERKSRSVNSSSTAILNTLCKGIRNNRQKSTNLISATYNVCSVENISSMSACENLESYIASFPFDSNTWKNSADTFTHALSRNTNENLISTRVTTNATSSHVASIAKLSHVITNASHVKTNGSSSYTSTIETSSQMNTNVATSHLNKTDTSSRMTTNAASSHVPTISAHVITTATTNHMNINEVRGHVSLNATSSHVNTKATSSHVTTTTISAHVNTIAIANHMNINEPTSHVNKTATSSHVNKTATSSHVNANATSSHVSANATSCHVNTNATSSHVNTNATSSRVNKDATFSHVNTNATSSHVNTNATSSNLNTTTDAKLTSMSKKPIVIDEKADSPNPLFESLKKNSGTSYTSKDTSATCSTKNKTNDPGSLLKGDREKELRFIPSADVPYNVQKYIESNYDAIVSSITGKRDLVGSKLLVHKDRSVEIHLITGESVRIRYKDLLKKRYAKNSTNPEIININDEEKTSTDDATQVTGRNSKSPAEEEGTAARYSIATAEEEGSAAINSIATAEEEGSAAINSTTTAEEGGSAANYSIVIAEKGTAVRGSEEVTAAKNNESLAKEGTLVEGSQDKYDETLMLQVEQALDEIKSRVQNGRPAVKSNNALKIDNIQPPS
ncbi:uncharacterized protein LOC130625454 [Hydractinia symbiolongicarpus]|uniref:uncharacterized protein LOC130625454 n=1 Tax=Hydractinia symbiolongicarpus TaxID=13093 RepID=UPI00254CD4A2|nr:uncharacterized protein LOC130625454 [Hydractinia symbiolongicarpus]